MQLWAFIIFILSLILVAPLQPTKGIIIRKANWIVIREL